MADPCSASPLPVLSGLIVAFGEPNVYVTGRHYFNTANAADPFELFVADSPEVRAALAASQFAEDANRPKDSMTDAVFVRVCGSQDVIVECVSDLAKKVAVRGHLFANGVTDAPPAVWSAVASAVGV